MKALLVGVLLVGIVACDDHEEHWICLCDGGGPIIEESGCNLLTQGGCNAGEKCTWINDQDAPSIGHVGCAPDPAASGIAIGEDCTVGPAGPMGYDTCVKGAVCLSGECKQICDQAGGAPTCGPDYACTVYAYFLQTAGTVLAGVCDPSCDPLTQDLDDASATAACGSPTPAMPTLGCYGYDDYSCGPVVPSVLTLTDRMAPRTNASGNAYLNGCAPGFIPFFYEMTGSTVTKCTGFCAALEVDNTTIGGLTPVQREDGDVTAAGKLPTTTKQPGDAICSITKKGSRDSSMCKFIWPYLADSVTGELPLQFGMGRHLDTLGICQAVEFFKYAKDADMIANDPFPNCRDLPRLTADPMDEDAADWGCQKFSSSQFIGGKAKLHPALSDVRIPKGLALEVVRHNLK